MMMLLPTLALLACLPQDPLPQADGYRGIWYMNQPSKDVYRYKYSGGMATYPQQHIPIAVYRPEANKTFFVYGGSVKGKHDQLLHMISYYDHATGTVPRPRILLDKKTGDAHDNPVLSIDGKGHLWIFSNAHGTARPAYIHRSLKPYSIDAFERTLKTNFSYGQPWHLEDRGFLFLHTRYARGRGLFWMTSPDGRAWSEPKPLAKMEKGHYQVSWPDGSRLGTAFNYHPNPVGLNARTNVYYVETRDFGATWKTVDGRTLKTPLTDPAGAALVKNTKSEGLLVYLKGLQYDADGNPVILYLTSKGYASGPKNDPRTWHTARWTGSTWETHPVTTSDHNYDFGPLFLGEKSWTIIAPTDPGPQPYGTGGDLVVWSSSNQGKTWKRTKTLTRGEAWNQNYVRRPLHAHDDFAALWADGHARKPSESFLYFTNRSGDHVWKLPPEMKGDSAEPEKLK